MNSNKERFIVYTYPLTESTAMADRRVGVADSRAMAVSLMERRVGRRPNLKSRDIIRRFLEGEFGQTSADCVYVSDETLSILAIFTRVDE